MKNKVFLYVLLAFSVLQFSCKTEAAKEEVKAEIPRFELHKGVNLSHWLSQCFGWSPRESFITEQDIKFIDSIGMDHVRIPVDEENLWDENGKKIQESFDYLHKCISWCKKYDLKVLVDLHIIRAHHFNALNGEGKNTLWTDTVAQANFVGLWYQLSDELKQYPTDFLAYEFLNEPVATDPDDWNKLIARCHKAIRAIEPERFIMIGSNEWQTPRMFPFLKIPENDKRIILAFHYYDPIFVTHYSAYWTEFKHYNGPVVYPGVSIPKEEADKLLKDTSNKLLIKRITESNIYYDKNQMAKDLAPVFEKAKALDLPIICTEFGAYNKIDPELRRAYYKDIMEVFREHNVAWSIWDLKGDFGLLLYDRTTYKTIGVDTMVVNAIMK